jgi:hypothetical protein
MNVKFSSSEPCMQVLSVRVNLAMSYQHFRIGIYSNISFQATIMKEQFSYLLFQNVCAYEHMLDLRGEKRNTLLYVLKFMDIAKQKLKIWHSVVHRSIRTHSYDLSWFWSYCPR